MQGDSRRRAFFERIESVHLALLLYVRSCHGSPSNELKVAAVRRLTDRAYRTPADPKVSHAQPP